MCHNHFSLFFVIIQPMSITCIASYSFAWFWIWYKGIILCVGLLCHEHSCILVYMCTCFPREYSWEWSIFKFTNTQLFFKVIVPVYPPSPGHSWVVQDVLIFANQKDMQSYLFNLHFPGDWYIEHYFTCFWCIWIFFCVKSLSRNFACFSIMLSSISLICRNLQCILDSRILLVLCDMNNFSLTVACLFILFLFYFVPGSVY